MPLIAGLVAALSAAQTPAPAVVIPDGAALTPIIAERDAALFSTMFDRCDPAVLANLVTDDLEFYHDRGGLTATRGVFVTDYARGCEARKAPDAWRSRRELVPGTMKVYVIPGIGAVEEGSHLFYERQGDGPEKLVGRALLHALAVGGRPVAPGPRLQHRPRCRIGSRALRQQKSPGVSAGAWLYATEPCQA